MTVLPCHRSDAVAVRTEMPLSLSTDSESVRVLPSSTLPASRILPAANSIRSVSVVFPASTCARIPKFKNALDGMVYC